MKTYDFTLESHLWTKEDIECPYELLAWLTDLAHIVKLNFVKLESYKDIEHHNI